ncbi:hypothetical protein L7F22_029321 [Adiantum nelumboides]|nr:hypothetical protein [Adiantum nelumboides]
MASPDPVGTPEQVAPPPVSTPDHMASLEISAPTCWQKKEDHSTIDPDDDKYSVMDAHVTTGEFVEPMEALAMIFRNAAACGPTLPTKSEFREVQERLGITEMGREAVSTTMASSLSSTNDSLVDLWNVALIKKDENQKLVVYDDKFIPRPRGRESWISSQEWKKLVQDPLDAQVTDTFTRTSLVASLKACGGVGALKRGQVMQAEISKRGLLEKDVIANAAISMYSKWGRISGKDSTKLRTRDMNSCDVVSPADFQEGGKQCFWGRIEATLRELQEADHRPSF